MTSNNRVSMGRNQSEPGCRTCPHMKKDAGGWWGWCQHPSNRVFSDGWPQGFTPSQGGDGGCDLHPQHVSGVTLGHHESKRTDPSILHGEQKE